MLAYPFGFGDPAREVFCVLISGGIDLGCSPTSEIPAFFTTSQTSVSPYF